MPNMMEFLWVIGISVVIILAILLIIWSMMNVAQKKKRQSESVQRDGISQNIDQTRVSVSQVVHEAHSQELIAVITAAVAASLNTSTYRLNIQSIQRAKPSAPVWSVAGRNELINNRF